MGWRSFYYPPYVSVAEKKKRALKTVEKLKKKGEKISPVIIDGRTICQTFWGKSWCSNLENYSDYGSRLERGRSYVRSGAVIDLQITKGMVKALVVGSSNYKVKINIKPINKTTWSNLKKECTKEISNIMSLLSGKLSKPLSDLLCSNDHGLFPKSKDIDFTCSCPDGAYVCKHIAATMYGIGHRLETEPTMLFLLRSVNHEDLIGKTARKLKINKEDNDLVGLFDIDLDLGTSGRKEKLIKKKVSRKKVSKKKVSKKKVSKKKLTK